jgi:diacylglycerol kinase family enzyme
MHRIKTRSALLRKLYGFIVPLCYLIGGVRAVFENELVNQFYEIDIDGERYDGNYSAIHIANGACFGGDLNVGPEPVPNDGEFDVFWVKSAGRLKTASMITDFTHGRWRRYPDAIGHRRAKIISIRSPKPLFINMDGEAFSDTSDMGISVKIVPNAVRFAAPRNLSYKDRLLHRGGKND